jgi:hypothetical protein
MFSEKTWALPKQSSLLPGEIVFFLKELLLLFMKVSFWGTYLVP